jgi:hypothetical protein
MLYNVFLLLTIMMRKLLTITLSILGLLALLFAKPSSANITNNLIISQIKVTTSGQFVTLYNNTDQAINMSSVKLEYFNNHDAGQSTSGKVVALSGSLPASGYFIVNDDTQPICYQAVVQSGSLSFSSTSGQVRVINFNNSPIGLVEDQVGWINKNAPTGVQLMPVAPAFLQRQSNNGAPIAGGTWQSVQPKTDDPCALVSFVTPNTPVPTHTSQLLLTSAPPPATIVSLVMSSSSSSKMAASNIGLMAPQLTELLPNPASPQSDSEDEFVELYNPNDKTFDLTGFKLQTGNTSKRTYSFPAGTTIAPKTFAAYPSANISVSLTNTGGQVWLLDPDENVISQTDVYTKAEDGYAWALANGKWYWTTTPTASGANVITGKGGSAAKTGSGVGTVMGASTNTPSNTASSLSGTTKPAPLHSGVLVGVGLLALLYGLYEYRHDIANGFSKARRYRDSWAKARAKS